MGSIEDTHQDRKTKAREELRSRSVGILLQIIDELEEMNLSVGEIETVLRNCRLNTDYAVRLGASIRDEKEKSHFHIDIPIHP